jgi:hypothetical protein
MTASQQEHPTRIERDAMNEAPLRKDVHEFARRERVDTREAILPHSRHESPGRIGRHTFRKSCAEDPDRA